MEFRSLQNLFEELGEGGKNDELLVASDPGKKKFRNFTEMFADIPSTLPGPIARGGGELLIGRAIDQ